MFDFGKSGLSTTSLVEIYFFPQSKMAVTHFATGSTDRSLAKYTHALALAARLPINRHPLLEHKDDNDALLLQRASCDLRYFYCCCMHALRTYWAKLGLGTNIQIFFGRL